jgi:hypothetical protein
MRDSMPEGLLFSDLAEVLPSDGACARPLGRSRRAPRPQPALRRFRPPSPTLQLLAHIRREVVDGLASLGQRLDRIEARLAGNAAATAALVETMDQLRVRICAFERSAGLIEQSAVPRASRRRPVA